MIVIVLASPQGKRSEDVHLQKRTVCQSRPRKYIKYLRFQSRIIADQSAQNPEKQLLYKSDVDARWVRDWSASPSTG